VETDGTDELVRFEVADSVATIVLNRPAKLNALTGPMIDRIEERVAFVRGSDEIRCLVISGNGRAFCAGDDIGSSGAGPSPSFDLVSKWNTSHVRVISDLLNLRIPVVAVLRGHVLGAGLDLALSCDFRIAGASAQLGSPVVKRGLGGAGVYLLTSYLGMGRATEMLLLGESCTAHDALGLGLVTSVVADADLDSEVAAWVRRLAVAPTGSIGAIKAARNRCLGTDTRRGLEAQLATSIEIQFLRDPVEGRNSWREHRPPQFTGGYRHIE
jgi:2-(1,2-epoxy-1,2-dihydrophenyl)acetyl-CoA isomerase